ncbi:glycosyltransferase family 4 protein [Mucilaginibacter corticis]|uniref:Glycosyltransferase family 4 protein n=1 Tax=Mucilaginibacter corticis TaxID=2597670 RepID=A0A556MM30_9SPHI|nr:glycosyltransferase [Mucilaginibacter corticis]TSJ40987.1 glycosyltransferase family 4 protein [Mucilaginibacter corticis]
METRKKNVIIFTNTLLSGGAEKQALLLAIKLKDTHNVTLVVYYGDKVEEKFRKKIAENQVPTVYLQGGHLNRIRGFYRLLKKDRTDVIFSYLLTTNLIGAVAGRLAGVRVRAGGIRNAQLDKNKMGLQRFIHHYFSTHTIFNNYDGLKQLSAKGFKTGHAVVIPNCFELNTTVMEREDTDLVKIITVGRFVAQKGYFDALEVMRILKAEGYRFKYFLVGFGELESELRQRISALQLEDVVEVLINPPDLNDYYQRSDIYFCSSFFEGLSNTVMEALSFSLPVVARNVGDNDRLVIDQVNGYLVPPNDLHLFIEPLKKLMASAPLRNEMGKESFKLIREVYSGDAFKNNYTNFISRAL